jgi:hypothetical protein
VRKTAHDRCTGARTYSGNHRNWITHAQLPSQRLSGALAIQHAIVLKPFDPVFGVT